MIFWMFYHINWFKKISTNRTWIVDCSRSFPPDSRCSSMPMSPMAMCQLLCGAGDGFNIPTLRSLLVPLRSQKTLPVRFSIFVHIFLHIYFWRLLHCLVCMHQLSGTTKLGLTGLTAKKHPKLWKPHVTLSKNASVLRQLFGDRFGWMWPPESQVFVPSQKTMVVSKIPSCLHARVEKIIYKCVKKHGWKPPRKNIETFDWKTLMFHFGLWRSLSQSQHPSLESAGTKVLQKLWPMDCFVHMVLSPPISCLMLTSSYPQGSKHNSFHVSQQITVSCGLGSSSGGLRQCLSFKARNQFFNSGSGALKKLNFTFFVVVSLYIYIYISEHCCWWSFSSKSWWWLLGLL